MTLEIPWLLFGMRLGLDETTRVFFLFTAALWLIAGAYATGDMAADPRRRSFGAFFVATCAGNLGLVLARDAASFYFFFSLMTFAAYGLVVHARGERALRAGRVYIALAVLGEGALLAGLLLAAAGADSLDLERMRAAAAASPERPLIVALLLVGFGVKAGALVLHVWLPLAHPVAPTPASAVLSGAMIKAGVLGWLQFLPLGEAALPGLGAALAAAGVAAALYAALVGLAQDDPKTVLAYSSVSQMGFIAVPLGAALAAPQSAPAALAAATFYALHHGLAKGALFLGAGVAPGLRQPLAFAALAAPALVLAGLPLSSGALAKYALKGALGEPAWGALAGSALSFAAVGTTLLMARFLFLVERGAGAHAKPGRLARAAWLACVAASLAAAWLPLGLRALPPMPGLSWADAWPLAAGVALSAAGAWRAAPWRGLRVAPGDVLVPASALLRALLAGFELSAAALGRHAWHAFGRLRRRWQVLVHKLSGGFDAAEATLHQAGPAAALLVLALVFLLAAIA